MYAFIVNCDMYKYIVLKKVIVNLIYTVQRAMKDANNNI